MTRSYDRHAVRAKRRADNPIVMTPQFAESAPGHDFPHAGGLVLACSQHPFPIRTEGRAAHRFSVSFEYSHCQPRRSFPQASRPVLACSSHHASIWTECCAVHPVAMAMQLAQALSVDCIPYAGGLV